MPSVTITPLQFDTMSILNCVASYLTEEFDRLGQLSITHSPENASLFASTGSLANRKVNTASFNTVNSLFAETYLGETVRTIRKFAFDERKLIGRVRLLQLMPKTCYTLHQDTDEFRYHIPLITNEKCFFVNNDVVERMPEIGRVYRFNTSEMHTAVNASNEKRIHLVFDTY